MKLSALLKNIGFAAFAYWDVRKIRASQKKIQAYRANGQYDLEREEIGWLQDTWGTSIIEHAGAKINIVGRENIPEEPCVVVANHQGYADIPILTQVMKHRQFGCVAKEELSKVPVFNRLITDVRSVYIKRNDARASLRAMETAIEHLELGFSMAIFPEGTRSQGPDMAEFKKGSLRLATKPGAPIVPVTISGSYKCFEEHKVVTGAEVNVYIHPPIYTKDMDRKEASNIAAVVEDIVRTKLVELQAEEKARGGK